MLIAAFVGLVALLVLAPAASAAPTPTSGADLISSATPVKTTVMRYTGDEAKVSVWCSSVFGLTGETVEEIPPSTSWFTATVDLRWQQWGGWQATELQMSDGPEPSDQR